MASFSVNLASIEKKFPKGMTVPPLLKDFAKWVAKQKHGSLGYFEVMAGGKFRDDSLTKEANKTIAEATGIFMQFGEGSELALWNHGDGPLAVVLIDSEGQNRTVASSFEAFLEKVTKHDTETELDGEMDDDDVPPQKHAELAAWLKMKKVKTPKVFKAPDFGKWVTKLAKSDKPPKAAGLPAPPKDMAARAIAAIGKKASDPNLAALLAELGIDLKNYKTADAQRHLLVPNHGYSLRFEKGVLDGVELTANEYQSWDYVSGKYAHFVAYPHEILKGVKVTDKLAAIKKKLGAPKMSISDGATNYWDLPKNVRLLVSCVDADETDGPIPPGGVQYICAVSKKR